jgi:hypothetical protein
MYLTDTVWNGEVKTDQCTARRFAPGIHAVTVCNVNTCVDAIHVKTKENRSVRTVCVARPAGNCPVFYPLDSPGKPAASVGIGRPMTAHSIHFLNQRIGNP